MNVYVELPDGISSEVQGVALMMFEKQLRALSGEDIRVYKQKMADDSKLRMMMTPEERGRI